MHCNQQTGGKCPSRNDNYGDKWMMSAQRSDDNGCHRYKRGWQHRADPQCVRIIAVRVGHVHCAETGHGAVIGPSGYNSDYDGNCDPDRIAQRNQALDLIPVKPCQPTQIIEHLRPANALTSKIEIPFCRVYWPMTSLQQFVNATSALKLSSSAKVTICCRAFKRRPNHVERNRNTAPTLARASLKPWPVHCPFLICAIFGAP